MRAYDIYDCDWVQGQAVKARDNIAYEDVKQNLLDWYGVINHLCAFCDVEKMYIPPTIDPDQSVIDNQMLFEKKFCQQLGMKAGDQVFELGCGKGRVAAHLASVSGAHITGINIDQGQLDNANAFAEKNGLAGQCDFINADFNQLPLAFADNQFDCIYEIQALSLCRDLEGLFKELNRIIKPGGKFSLLEWVRLPAFNPDDVYHQDLMKKIKPLIGAIGTPSPKEYETLLRQAGFKVLVSEDPSINRSQEPLINKAGSIYDNIYLLIKLLVKIRLLPPHFITLIDRLGKDTDALCEADRLGLVTMSYHIVAERSA